jgi:hypothetical protein
MIRDEQVVFSQGFAFGDTRVNLAPIGEIRYVEGLGDFSCFRFWLSKLPSGETLTCSIVDGPSRSLWAA